MALRLLVISALSVACGKAADESPPPKHALDTGRLDDIVAAARRCADLPCAKQAVAALNEMSKSVAGRLSPEDEQRYLAGVKEVDARRHQLEAPPAGTRLKPGALFEDMFILCHATFANANLDTAAQAMFAKARKRLADDAAKLGVTLPPEPRATDRETRLAHVDKVAESFLAAARRSGASPQEQHMIAIGIANCAVWAFYPDESQEGSWPQLIEADATKAGIDRAAWEPLVAKIKAHAPRADVQAATADFVDAVEKAFPPD